jgi:hypothetical protein
MSEFLFKVGLNDDLKRKSNSCFLIAPLAEKNENSVEVICSNTTFLKKKRKNLFFIIFYGKNNSFASI